MFTSYFVYKVPFGFFVYSLSLSRRPCPTSGVCSIPRRKIGGLDASSQPHSFSRTQHLTGSIRGFHMWQTKKVIVILLLLLAYMTTWWSVIESTSYAGENRRPHRSAYGGLSNISTSSGDWSGHLRPDSGHPDKAARACRSPHMN